MTPVAKRQWKQHRAATAAGCYFALLACWSTTSRANGRFPEANQLVVDPLDPTHLVVRTTFGILRSVDAGATWTWICETVVSPLGLLDEELMITAGGRTSVALSNGINVGDRSFCDWQRATGDVVGQQVTDLMRVPGAPAAAYASVAVTTNGLLAGRIARTTDGLEWSFVGELLADTVPLTIEIAPSRPERMYLGLDAEDFAVGRIDRSDDAGLTWMHNAAPGDPQSVYLSAVDPVNPDRVYVRSRSAVDNTLYVSEDAGATWVSVYNDPDAPLTGFALSPDGLEVAVGSDNGMAILARTELDNGSSLFAVARTSTVATKCLTWTAEGLYVCASEATDGYTIGLSKDEGRTFRPLLRAQALTPTACAVESATAMTCPDLWCPIAMTLGASCAPAAAPPSQPDAGASADGESTPRAAASSGCTCEVPPSPVEQTTSALMLVLAAALPLRLRRLGRGARDRRVNPRAG